MSAKIKRRSPATKALEELSALLQHADDVLSLRASDNQIADYAMRVGGAKHFVSEMRRVIEAAQKAGEK